MLTPSATGLLAGGEAASAVRRELTPTSAWQGGTSLARAVKVDPSTMRAWLALQIGRLVKDVGATNTLQDADDLITACDALLAEFPALKMEEVCVVCDLIRRGKLLPKLFGTFRTRELMDAFRAYEGEYRADVLERMHRVAPDPNLKRVSELRPKFEPITLSDAELKEIGIWPTFKPDSPSDDK